MMHVKVGMDGDLPMRIQTPGTYEWWYFDAIDENQELAITIIFFDGMPMSPYWLEALPKADSRDFSGYAVSLYRRGKKVAGFVHHTEHNEVIANGDQLHIRMGGMTFKKDGNSYIIGIDTKYPDSTHSLHGELVFHSTNSNIDVVDYGEGNHCWRLIAPQCTVEGNFALSQYDDIHSEWIFNGHGYHDCNSGTDALDADYDDWYWGRCDIGNNQTIIYYHYPSSPNTQELSIGFIADSAHGIRKIEQCSIKLEDITITSSLMRIASSIIIQGFISGKSLNIRINHIHTLEFGPFYYRFMIKTESDMLPQHNLGIAEYFNAKRLKSRLVRTMIKTPMQRV